MSVDKVDLLFLHDPEYVKDINDIKKKDGAFDELFKLKSLKRLHKSLFLQILWKNRHSMFPMIKNWDFDVLINHNRYTFVKEKLMKMYDYDWTGAGKYTLIKTIIKVS